MPLPAPSAVAELLKPITWFPPMWAFGCGVVASGQSLDGRLGLVAAEALPFMDPEFSDTPEAAEQLNEASRAAFAAWLHAERLVADGSATVPRGTRKPSPRRKR